MAREHDASLFYRHAGSYRFNVKYKSGGLDNHVRANYLQGCRVKDIDFIWIVEEGRKATPEEIKQLRAGKYLKQT
jgi:hypothetical protein